MRQGHFAGRQRSQAQLAISADGASWYLVNASPDLRYQIESFPPLHPNRSIRHSPIAGIILVSAELDAALGLLLLRESQPLTVYATEAIRRILTEDNSFFQVLRRQAGQVTWVDILPGIPFQLGESRICCRPVSSSGGFPGFVSAERATSFRPEQAVLGLYLEHQGRRLGVFPAVPHVRPEWLEQFKTCDALLFDGTFWSEDELIRTQGSGKLAAAMGHLPVQETLIALAAVETRKILIHINNTNPILDESSSEYRAVGAAGWEIAYDGMELTL